MEFTFEQLPKAISQLCADVAFIKLQLSETITRVQPAPDQLLTIQEAAGLLTLSVPTIYGLVSRSEIPSMKKGKRLYFSKEELLSWLRTGRKQTIADAAATADNYLKNKKR